MEIIRLPGYTEYEKLHIAEGFLVPKQLKANGLAEHSPEFTKNAILTIIRRYTREAGVRNLEREIASISRKIAREVARNKEKAPTKVIEKSVQKYLGPPQYRSTEIEDQDQVGMVTGLAWTQVGGELLNVETALMPGKGELIVTGKLGDVMKESAKAAVSYVRSRSERLGLDPKFYEKVDIHIHIPEGAIPKDGPSAGISMCTSIVSALTKRPVYRDIAMTGEITLRGRVLPIGGLKEKIIAAHRGGIKKVVIPKENEKDLRDIPQSISKQLEIVLVEHLDEVLTHALIHDKDDKLFKEDDVAFEIPAEMEQHPPEQRTSLN
jgi:ATP-dependent Lon protease